MFDNMVLGFYSLSVLILMKFLTHFMFSILCRPQMPLYCSRFMFAPCKRTLGDVVTDHSSRMYRRCWRKLWHPGRPYTSSVPSSPDSDLKSLEMSTQSEKPFHTPVMVKEVLQFLDIKPGQVSQSLIRNQLSWSSNVYTYYYICLICFLDLYIVCDCRNRGTYKLRFKSCVFNKEVDVHT